MQDLFSVQQLHAEQPFILLGKIPLKYVEISILTMIISFKLDQKQAAIDNMNIYQTWDLILTMPRVAEATLLAAAIGTSLQIWLRLF